MKRDLAWLTTFAMSMRDEKGLIVTKGVILQQGDDVDGPATYQQLLKFFRMACAMKARITTWNGSGFDCGWALAYALRYDGEDRELFRLIFEVEWFDGMLLWRHLDQVPSKAQEGSHNYRLDDATQRFEKAYAGYKQHGADLYHDTRPEKRRELLAYNKNDCEVTLLHTERFWSQLTAKQQRCCLIEASCIPYISLANVTGQRVNKEAVAILSHTLRTVGQHVSAQLAPLGVTETTVRSNQRLTKLLYEKWGLPVIKRNDPTAAEIKKALAAGLEAPTEGKPSTDKEVLYELGLDDERVYNIQLLRESLNLDSKFMGGLKKSTDYGGEDNVTYPQAKIFGTYCVPGDVEVLTREGWVALKAWNGGDIMQVEPDLTMSFRPATRFIGPVVDRWVGIDHQTLKCRFTHGHTMPYLAQKTGAWRTKQAHDFLLGEARAIPRGGLADLRGPLTPDQMRLCAAIQADAYDTERYLKWTFKKRRKIERLVALLGKLGIRHRTYVCEAYPDRTEVVIAKTFRPAWTQGRKSFGPWLLDTTLEGLTAFVEEVEFWDGSRHEDGGYKYASAIRSNVEWVVTCAALVGRRAGIHSANECHVSDVTTRPVAVVLPRHVAEVDHSERAYCATTQTGFWLARSNGHIFVTGNTGRVTYTSKQGRGKMGERHTGYALHQMKRDKRFRNCIEPPPGYTLVEFDAAGQEFRWMAIKSGDPTMLGLCEEDEDPHSFMTAQIYGWDYRFTVKQVGDEIEVYVNGRKLGKVANLCIAEGTIVLTDRGPCNIEDVRRDDLVWDGLEFVTHGGVSFSGVRDIMSYMGLSATPTHEVLIGDEWRTHEDAARHGWRIQSSLGQGWARRGRSTVRIVDGLVRRYLREVGGTLRESAMRLWDRARCEPYLHGARSIGAVQGLCCAATPSEGRQADDRKHRRSSFAQACQRDAATLHEPERSFVSQLRRTWDRVSIWFDPRDGRVHQGGITSPDLPSSRHRSKKQRRSLRAWQLALGLAQGEFAEPQAVRTYDILDCGPRSRFVAAGVIVHNSLQYRTSAPKLRVVARVQYQLPMEMHEAQHVHKTYMRTYSDVPRYWQNQVGLAKTQGWIETIAGRRIRIDGNWSDRKVAWAMGSTAINFPIQGTGADQKYLAIRCLRNIIAEYDAIIGWDLHDGIYFYVPRNRAPEFIERAKAILDHLPYREAWGFNPPVPLPWDAKYGRSWGDMKGWKPS